MSMAPVRPHLLLLALLSAVILLTSPGCKKAPAPATSPPVEPAPGSTLGRPDCAQDFAACLQDADCVQVASGCCSCAMGGEDTAIHRSCREAWLKQQGDCLDTLCTAEFKCQEGLKPRCREHRCVLSIEAEPLGPPPATPPPPVTPAPSSGLEDAPGDKRSPQ